MAYDDRSLTVRFPREILAAVDEWAADDKSARSEAIRRLVEKALTTENGTKRKPRPRTIICFRCTSSARLQNPLERMAVDCLADRVFRYAELHGHVPYIGLRGHITHPYGFNLFGVEFSTIVTNFPGDWRNQRAAAVGQSTNDVAHRSLGDTVFRSQREEPLSRSVASAN